MVPWFPHVGPRPRPTPTTQGGGVSFCHLVGDSTRVGGICLRKICKIKLFFPSPEVGGGRSLRCVVPTRTEAWPRPTELRRWVFERRHSGQSPTQCSGSTLVGINSPGQPSHRHFFSSWATIRLVWEIIRKSNKPAQNMKRNYL